MSRGIIERQLLPLGICARLAEQRRAGLGKIHDRVD